MSILDRIVDDTRELLARRKQTVSLDHLESMPAFARPTRSLRRALRRSGLSVIAEIKKASPSEGAIRDPLHVEQIARSYARNGAAAISVLTEPTHFQGSLENLERTRLAVDLPLLRKDFIVDPYQLVEARAHGADAVLLIATILDREQLRDLHQAAEELRLDCLVELYDASELERVDLDQVQILGVNNRDLKTFEVDLDHAPRVLEQVPDHIATVSESGMRTRDDLERVARQGIDAVLIGTTLMRADDPGRALAKLHPDTSSRTTTHPSS